MTKQNQKTKQRGANFVGIVAGLLVGGLAGGMTMLLLAPRSGKDMRMQIRNKGIGLRDQTTGIIEDAVANVRSNANKITIGGYEKFKEIKQQSQDLAVEQLDRVTEAVQVGKKAIQSS